MTEMIGQLNFEPPNIRCTNRQLTIFNKAINSHLALSIRNLQPVLCPTRHISIAPSTPAAKTVTNIHSFPEQYNIGIHYQTK